MTLPGMRPAFIRNYSNVKITKKLVSYKLTDIAATVATKLLKFISLADMEICLYIAFKSRKFIIDAHLSQSSKTLVFP